MNNLTRIDISDEYKYLSEDIEIIPQRIDISQAITAPQQDDLELVDILRIRMGCYAFDVPSTVEEEGKNQKEKTKDNERKNNGKIAPKNNINEMIKVWQEERDSNPVT